MNPAEAAALKQGPGHKRPADAVFKTLMQEANADVVSQSLDSQRSQARFKPTDQKQQPPKRARAGANKKRVIESDSSDESLPDVWSESSDYNDGDEL